MLNAQATLVLIKIVSETAVAAGVRRIEALSGQGARGYLGDQDKRLKEVSDILKTTPTDVPDRLRTLVDERKNLEKALAEAKRKLAMGGSGWRWRRRYSLDRHSKIFGP